MRLCVLLPVVLLSTAVCSLSASAAAAPPAGMLDVEGASGLVEVKGSGGLLGRVAQGSIVLVNHSLNEPWTWWLNGKRYDRRVAVKGVGLSFRILGGDYLLIARGTGISISASGRGAATLLGMPNGYGLTGSYTTDSGADCQASANTCPPLPTGVAVHVLFGSPGGEAKQAGTQPTEHGPGTRTGVIPSPPT